MKRIIATALTIITLTLALTGCSQAADAPEGMQLVRGGESVGYYMYAPEEWIVANREELGISCTYVSKVNNTSVTLVESSFTEANAVQYITEELARFPEGLDMKITLDIKEDALGNAKKAWKTSYTYKYGEFEYRVLQLFGIYLDRSYILTYSASTGSYDGEVSYYDKFLEQAQAVIDNIEFVELKADSATAPEYTKDADGFSLISDKSLCGFVLLLRGEQWLYDQPRGRFGEPCYEAYPL